MHEPLGACNLCSYVFVANCLYFSIITHPLIFARFHWLLYVTWRTVITHYNPSNIFNKDNSLHLGRKYARIFVLGHYLFLVAHSFPRATLSENCSLLGTDNVRGQISEHIFTPNGGYCLYNPHLSSSSDFVLLLLVCRKKMSAREFQFSSLLFYMEEKRPSFVNSSDSDIRKLLSNVVSEITKSQQNTNQKAEERQVVWGTGRVHFTSQSVNF